MQRKGMRRKMLFSLFLVTVLVTSLFSACGKKKLEQPTGYKTPKDFTPKFYTKENELPDDAYFIRHKTKEGYQYYPLLTPENTFDGTAQSNYTGFDDARIVWVNYNKDEGLIPTMGKGDDLIYKSTKSIPNKYALEKFFDRGYTIGVSGLKKDTSGNYAYVSAKSSGMGRVLTTSDAAGFDGLDADSIYLNKLDKTRITDANVSSSGTITGLKRMRTYQADIRTGTERIMTGLTCNAHLFVSAETYLFGEFTFLTPVTAKLSFPDYATDGYYTIGGKNFFRYVKDGSMKSKLSASEANKQIYLYDDNDNSSNTVPTQGSPVGTTIGKTWDENGFLIDAPLSDESNVSEEKGIPYEEFIKAAKNRLNKNGSNAKEGSETDSFDDGDDSDDTGATITKKTKLKEKTDDGYYAETCTVSSVSDAVTTGDVSRYDIVATGDTDTDGLHFVYYWKEGDEKIEAGKTYHFIFRPDTNGYDAYAITSFSETKDE